MNIDNVDKIITYALIMASREDFGNRELGPIHLIKYIYLADLAFAERNNGNTFTGLNWNFHNFGPWEVEAYKRLSPACQAAGANEKKISSQYNDDFTRWSLSDDDLLKSLDRDLPFIISSTVKRAVHEFGADTNRLLHYVYRTQPMLNAAPGELLVFHAAPVTQQVKTSPDPVAALSIKAQKRRKAELTEIRNKIQQKLAEKRLANNKKLHIRKPRYDEVFEAGCQWLDSLAGQEIKDFMGEAVFTPDIWKSRARFDPELS